MYVNDAFYQNFQPPVISLRFLHICSTFNYCLIQRQGNAAWDPVANYASYFTIIPRLLSSVLLHVLLLLLRGLLWPWNNLTLSRFASFFTKMRFLDVSFFPCTYFYHDYCYVMFRWMQHWKANILGNDWDDWCYSLDCNKLTYFTRN